MPDFLSEDGKWVLANINCMGYFRVNYDPVNWDRLLSQLEINIHVSLPHLCGTVLSIQSKSDTKQSTLYMASA